jgi:hypothetical protein
METCKKKMEIYSLWCLILCVNGLGYRTYRHLVKHCIWLYL